MSESSIIFPNLGIELHDVGNHINIGGFSIYYYGIIIAVGVLFAYSYIMRVCPGEGIAQNDFIDVFLAALVLGVIGARIYYVVFKWEYFAGDPLRIINIHNGGLAIYGGIIGGFIAIFLVCRLKKLPLLKVLDVTMPAVLIGQIFGRWGNFFNREVFGGYSDGLLAMGIPIDAVHQSSDITSEMLSHVLTVGGVDFVTVHPTFLYESLWNLALFLILALYVRRHKAFDGEIFALYFVGYGIGRFWIEGVRTDRLLIPHTDIAVSQALSAVLVVAGIVGFTVGMIKARARR